MVEPNKTAELMELPDSLIVYDTLVFFAGLLVAFIYLYRISQKYSFDFHAVMLFLIYILCSYSSYNIMVMPIHDYNIAIARNFIYHYKSLKFLSITDIVFVMLAFSILVSLALNKSDGKFISRFEPRIQTLISIAILQAAIIALLSTIGYIVHMMEGGVGLLKNQLIYFRGIIYFFVILYFFYQSWKSISSIGFYAVLSVFCLLDLINFASGLISSFIYYDFLWERYGIKITIIDQDKIYNYFTIYALLFVSFIFRRPLNNQVVYSVIMLIGLVMYLNIYKFLFAIAILFVLYEVVIGVLTKSASRKKIVVILIAGIIALPMAINLYSSKSMHTRSGQLSDYWEYTGHHFPFNLIGIGYGGMYYSPTGVADKGETKKIDLEQLGANYKRSIQTPMLTQLKNSGIIGLFIMLVIACWAAGRLLRLNIDLSKDPFSNAVCFNVLWLIGSTSIVLQPYPMPSLTFIKLILLLSLLLNNWKANGHEAPKHSGMLNIIP